MKEKKKKSKKGIIIKTALITLLAVGSGYLAYKKIPNFKNFVDEILPNKKPITTTEIKTKPFRKYETFNKKR